MMKHFLGHRMSMNLASIILERELILIQLCKKEVMSHNYMRSREAGLELEYLKLGL